MSKYIDTEKLIAEIERRIEETKSMKPSFDQFWAGQISAFKGVRTIISSLQQEESEVWVKIDAEHPLPYCQEVIGYNKEWVDEDFNPSGTRVGFLTDTGFLSAMWVNDQDCYTTCFEEGDDYKISQILPDGTRKTWRKYETGEAVEGYLPNMPTHFMLIPKTPDGFTWPYNTEKEIKQDANKTKHIRRSI